MPTPRLLTSPRPQLLADLAVQLSARTARGAEGLTELRVHPTVPRSEVDNLLTQLHPVQIDVVEDDTVDGMVLHVGSVARVATPVRVRVPPAWRDAVALTSLPILTPCVHVAVISVPAGVSLAAHLLLAILGLPDTGCWQDGDGLSLRVNERACRGIQPARIMRIYGDAGTAAVCRRELRGLRRDGWEVEVVETERAAEGVSIRVPADLDPSVHAQIAHSLRDIVNAVVDRAVTTHANPWVEVRLPELRDPAPALPNVLLRTDAPADVHAFIRSLRKLGVRAVRVQASGDFASGFALRHHPEHPTELLRELDLLVAEAIDLCGAKDRHYVNIYAGDVPGRREEIEIDLPTHSGGDGSLLRSLRGSIGRWHVRLSNVRKPADLARRLENTLSSGAARARVSSDGRSQSFPCVAVRNAPLEIGQMIRAAIEAETGVRVPCYRIMGSPADDIPVILPEDVTVRLEPAPVRQASRGRTEDGRPFLEITDVAVRLGEHTLPRRVGHPLAPSLDLYTHTCIDAPTASLLAHLAASLRLREPVLLEGPTAAGKTSTVLFLAALLGQPVVRVNLSGQTDTGELIGRFAPRDGGWAWQEGVIPRAMREGSWVILDEVNLADPAVIERLNPVLERTPSLLLTEGDGTRFGPGGVPVAPGFHVFATMNPSDGDYGGRNALSPALRDRFAAQLLCATPNDEDARHLLVRVVFGEQPAISVCGVDWGRSTGHETTHGTLACVSGIRGALHCLARFHMNVDAAAHAEAEHQRIGAGRRGGVLVSRRTLLSVLDYLVLRVDEVGLQRALDEAVDRYYAARLGTPADRNAVLRLAEAAGLFSAGAET